MGRLILLNIELGAIHSFLKAVTVSADVEYSKIKAMSEAGEFSHYDDESNAYFEPEMWEIIAIRATLGELNSLVEWELQNIANALPPKKDRRKEKENVRFVFDFKINELIDQIENFYKIKIKDLACYKEIEIIRRKVNSFKHRKGFKHPSKDNCNVLGEKFKTSREDAFQSIDSVRIFLNDIRSRTKLK